MRRMPPGVDRNCAPWVKSTAQATTVSPLVYHDRQSAAILRENRASVDGPWPQTRQPAKRFTAVPRGYLTHNTTLSKAKASSSAP